MAALRDLLARLLDEPRRRSLLLGLWCVGWLVVAVVSIRPLTLGVPLGSDKLAHFLVYAAMAAGAVGFCRRPLALGLLAALAAAIGGLLEIAQGLTPYRSMDVGDAVANGLGAAAGYVIALAFLAWLRLGEEDADAAVEDGAPARAPARAGRSRPL